MCFTCIDIFFLNFVCVFFSFSSQRRWWRFFFSLCCLFVSFNSIGRLTCLTFYFGYFWCSVQNQNSFVWTPADAFCFVHGPLCQSRSRFHFEAYIWNANGVNKNSQSPIIAMVMCMGLMPILSVVIPFTILISVQFRIRQWWMYVQFFHNTKANVVYIELHANILLMRPLWFERVVIYFLCFGYLSYSSFSLPLSCSLCLTLRFSSFNPFKVRHLLHLALTHHIPVLSWNKHFSLENDTLIAWAFNGISVQTVH